MLGDLRGCELGLIVVGDALVEPDVKAM